jgi:DNA phosphorothioation-associated putative methyltransferase
LGASAGHTQLNMINRSRTAVGRASLSRPIVAALEDGLLPAGTSVFDFGCGRGGDIQRLRALGYPATGWDPVHAPDAPMQPANVVNLGYVINVIEDPQERLAVLSRAWKLTTRLLIVAARPEWEGRDVHGRSFRDGILTSKGTFQKFYRQDELRAWIDRTLGLRSIAAAPGVFYVFRDDQDAEAFRARRIRRTSQVRTLASEVLYESHRGILSALEAFVGERGRLPDAPELAEGVSLVEAFGSIRAAFAVIRRNTGDERWSAVRIQATLNLLVYLALRAFGGRPRMSALPEDLQRDIRALFGSYKAAVFRADQLLFAAGKPRLLDKAMRDSPAGKLLPDALYVHISALGALSPVVRVYEGCGRVLLGTVEGATITKLSRTKRRVAYLSYPAFDSDPHPSLAFSIRADLQTFDIKYRDFRQSGNAPVLHRKEAFVTSDYPGRQKFARLTAQEERIGLFSDPTLIGTRQAWEAALASRGVCLRGHRLVKSEEAGTGRAPATPEKCREPVTAGQPASQQPTIGIRGRAS